MPQGRQQPQRQQAQTLAESAEGKRSLYEVNLAREGEEEVGAQGMWTVSSAKSGLGGENLRDGDPETYWQSDAPCCPHHVMVQFKRRMHLSAVMVFVDHPADESYTPAVLSVSVSNMAHGPMDEAPDACAVMTEVCARRVPPGAKGWICMRPPKPVYAHVLRLTVVENFAVGKDSHIRQVFIYALRQHPNQCPLLSPASQTPCTPFTTLR